MKPGQLHETWINPSHRASVRRRYERNDIVFEPPDGLRLCQFVDTRWITTRVDRPRP